MYPSLGVAITEVGKKLLNSGHSIKTEKWQGIDISDKPEYHFWEILNVHFQAPIGDEEHLNDIIKPNQPWADVHFEERISGIPYNPPPSNEIWPFNQNKNEAFKTDEKFSHTYPERFYPKFAGRFSNDIMIAQGAPQKYFRKDGGINGIRYNYGDLDDVINLLRNEPNTRQAFLPVWFPEDTGAVHGGRVPCTIGYHFIHRRGYLHITYYIRACDYLRHFRDDIYLACKLLYYILNQLRVNVSSSIDWDNVKAGIFTMQIVSLHVFYHEQRLLLK